MRWRCINVDVTLYKRHVRGGTAFLTFVVIAFCAILLPKARIVVFEFLPMVYFAFGDVADALFIGMLKLLPCFSVLHASTSSWRMSSSNISWRCCWTSKQYALFLAIKKPCKTLAWQYNFTQLLCTFLSLFFITSISNLMGPGLVSSVIL